MIRRPPRSTRTDTLFPYTTLFRSLGGVERQAGYCRHNAKDGGDIDDRSVAAGAQVRHRRAHPQPSAHLLDRDDVVPPLDRLILYTAHTIESGVVRSETRRVGEEGVSAGGSGWSRYHYKKK